MYRLRRRREIGGAATDRIARADGGVDTALIRPGVAAAVTDDVSERPPDETLLETLAVRRNVAVGVGVGLAVAAVAYAVRVFELLGPVSGARTYPIVGPEAWFVLLAAVFAASTALGVTLLLTAVRAYRLTRSVSDEDG